MSWIYIKGWYYYSSGSQKSSSSHNESEKMMEIKIKQKSGERAKILDQIIQHDQLFPNQSGH
jgi:hypothetical protein